MKLDGEASALVTGAASGIGRAVALHLGARGVGLTLVDFNEAQGQETAHMVERLGAKGKVQFLQADVTNPSQLAHAFSQHMETFGRMDICVNNAGIGEAQFFLEDRSSDGHGAWRKVLDINLTAVVDGTRLAIQAMQRPSRGAKGGLVLNIASAAGLYPSPTGPVYSASKGGVVLFTRSLAHLAKGGVRVNALCPEFIETGIIGQMSGKGHKAFGRVLKTLGGFISMDALIDGMTQFVEDNSLAGECMWITNRHGRQWWPSPEERKRYQVGSAGSAGQPTATSASRAHSDKPAATQNPPLPSAYSKMIVTKLSTDFRSATAIVSAPLKLPLPAEAVLVRVHYAGVNASDVNFSAGRYFGSPEEAARRIPFDAGFEAVGVVVAVGEAVQDPALACGRTVAAMHYGSFADYIQIESKMALPMEGPPSAEAVALLTSGLTASIALEQAGRMGTGQTVLVTAAAGGTGQFAVQLAKLAGNRVVATCGAEDKVALLKSLGADVVINYRTQEVAQELKRSCPRGVDIVYESVGGKMFQTCLNALARQGTLIIIGMMSQYTTGAGGSWSAQGFPGLCEKLLWKSQALVGFFLLHYMGHMRRHLARLQQLTREGHLKVSVDPAKFVGLHSAADAVEHLQSGRSIGKVVIQMSNNNSQGPGHRSNL